MDAVRQYIISISSAAFFCGIAKSILQKGPGQKLVNILCGTFLAFTFLAPLCNIDLDRITLPIPESDFGEADAITEGSDMKREEISEMVISEVKAYIIEKAQEYGASVDVDITLSENELLLPVAIKITGEVTPYAKKHLQQIIREDLGIPEEDQLWTG